MNKVFLIIRKENRTMKHTLDHIQKLQGQDRIEHSSSEPDESLIEELDTETTPNHYRVKALVTER